MCFKEPLQELVLHFLDKAVVLFFFIMLHVEAWSPDYWIVQMVVLKQVPALIVKMLV